MRTLIFIFLALYTCGLGAAEEFPLNIEYMKKNIPNAEKSIAGYGGEIWKGPLIELKFVNEDGVKLLEGPEIDIDLSSFDYVKNEGNCQVYIRIDGHIYKSTQFRSCRIPTIDKTGMLTGIHFSFENSSTVFQVCIFNDFQASGLFIFRE